MHKRFLILFSVIFAISAHGEVAYEIFPVSGEGYRIQNDQIYYRNGQFGFILRGGDALTRSNYYAERGYRRGDPLRSLSTPDSTPILMTVFNRSESPLQFQPQKIVLRVDNRSYLPLIPPALWRMIRILPQQMQHVLQLSIYHQEENVPASSVVSKFLIYSGSPEQSQNIQMELDPQFFPGVTVSTIFHFAKVKVIRN